MKANFCLTVCVFALDVAVLRKPPRNQSDRPLARRFFDAANFVTP